MHPFSDQLRQIPTSRNRLSDLKNIHDFLSAKVNIASKDSPIIIRVLERFKKVTVQAAPSIAGLERPFHPIQQRERRYPGCSTITLKPMEEQYG